MYRVMFWIGTGFRHCDMRTMGIENAKALQDDYIARGYSACIVGAQVSCSDAEAGFAIVHQESAHF